MDLFPLKQKYIMYKEHVMFGKIPLIVSRYHTVFCQAEQNGFHPKETSRLFLAESFILHTAYQHTILLFLFRGGLLQ